MSDVNEMLFALNQPEALSADWKQQIYDAETTRVTSINPAEYRALIAKLDSLQALLAKDPTQEKTTGILSIVRLKATTQMQLASYTPNLSAHVDHLSAARQTLIANHLDPELQTQAGDIHESLRGERVEFAIELARDVAKYLDKVAKVTGDLSFHADAAQVLDVVTRAFEKNLSMSDKITAAPERESYHLAHFERLIQLDLAGSKVDSAEVILYVMYLAEQDLKEGTIQNWDRQAAIGWWLFEFGVRHQRTDLMEVGMQRVDEATHASKGKKSKMGYIVTRLVANAFEMGRRARFVLSSAEKQAEIKQQLALSKE